MNLSIKKGGNWGLLGCELYFGNQFKRVRNSTMSLVGKLVSELEINASAEKYYKLFKDQAFHMPNVSPKIIQEVEVHEGDWDNHGHGSIKIWKYTVGKYIYKWQKPLVSCLMF